MTKPEPVLETSTIRLSVDETRTIVKHMMAGKPLNGSAYHNRELVELGILKRIEVPEEKDTAQKIAECWKRTKLGLQRKDSGLVHQAMHDLEKLNTDRHREEPRYQYELTAFGRQIARGISVRLSSQGRSV